MVVEPRGRTRRAVCVLSVTRNGDNQASARHRLLSKDTSQLEAVHIGKADVEEATSPRFQ